MKGRTSLLFVSAMMMALLVILFIPGTINAADNTLTTKSFQNQDGPIFIPQAGLIRPGFDQNTFAANDDFSTGAVNIGFTVDFFGFSGSQLNICNNGYVFFDDLSATDCEYTPTDLTATSKRIIAPFYADVDTGGVGNTPVTYGTGTVDGKAAFGVNWINVGYYDERVDKLNSFQLILINQGAGNFDIEFNYDKIQWETGEADGGVDGLGGYSARAGYSNGTGLAGTFFELEGSAINGAFLDGGPNSLSALGRLRFQVRSGGVVLNPIAVNDTYKIPLNGTLNLPAPGVLVNDTNYSGLPSALTATEISGFSNAVSYSFGIDGALMYQAGGVELTDTLTYQVDDGKDFSDPATITVQVLLPRPTPQNDTYTTTVNVPLNVSAAAGVLNNDTHNFDAAFSINIQPTDLQPLHGVLQFNNNGSFVYTPITGYAGSDSFTYTVSDGLQMATATVTINVVNRAPQANDDIYTVRVNIPLTIAAPGYLANDAEPDGETYVVALVSGTSNGTLSFNNNGSFTYAPNFGFTGTDTFVYSLNDGKAVDNATVTLEVTGSVPTDTIANLETQIVQENGIISPIFSFTLPLGEGGLPINWEWFKFTLKSMTLDAVLLNNWFPVDQYCTALICDFTLPKDVFPAGLPGGEYTWSIEVWGPDAGFVTLDESQFATFEIQVDPPTIPQHVQVEIVNGRVIVSWDFDPNAAWYQLVVYDADGNVIYDGWHSATELTCDGSRCSIELPNLPELNFGDSSSTPGLTNGDYSIEVRSWGPGGFNAGNSEASATPLDFSLDLPAPGAAQIPLDYAITNTKSGSPTFRWTPDPNATWQLLWIGTPTGLPGQLTDKPILTYHIRWYPVSAMDCVEGEGQPCLFTPDDVFLSVGDYEYWVLSWGPGGTSTVGQFLGWTQGPTFDVTVEEPQPALPMTPTGRISTGTAHFAWNHVPDVTWYRVWVGQYYEKTETYSTNYMGWYRAKYIGCLDAEQVCSIDPERLYLPEGDYVWYIQSYNPAWVNDEQVKYWSVEPGSFIVDR